MPSVADCNGHNALQGTLRGKNPMCNPTPTRPQQHLPSVVLRPELELQAQLAPLLLKVGYLQGPQRTAGGEGTGGERGGRVAQQSRRTNGRGDTKEWRQLYRMQNRRMF
jgi:hypothetical protein